MECPMWVFPGCLPAGLTRLAGETEAGWPGCGVGRSLMMMAGAQGELGELKHFQARTPTGAAGPQCQHTALPWPAPAATRDRAPQAKVTVVASGVVLQGNKNHANPPGESLPVTPGKGWLCPPSPTTKQTAEGRVGLWEP